jgi:RNA polymerase sigma-70 factor, ECF subfamily
MINDTASDESIIKAVREGGKALFEIIVKRYNDRIFSIGYRFFRNKDDAVDFVQEVFLKAFQKLGTYSERAPFKHWLVKIAYNHGINCVKNSKIESTIDGIDIPQKSELTSEDSVARSEIIALLNNAVRKLPPQYQICIDLYFFWELKLNKIAKITKIPINTVKSNVRRGKMILYDSLKGTIAEEYHEL